VARIGHERGTEWAARRRVRYHVDESDWEAQLQRHSLGWVCARQADMLVGFVNVVWDGSGHAFLLDTIVAKDHERQGIGTQLVKTATLRARESGMR
jgi:ribosomal protein S18 acetylase RimI-like enzyme